MHLFRMAIILVKWTPGGCSRHGQRRTKGVSYKVCLHVGTGEFHTSARAFVHREFVKALRHRLSARPTACGFSIFLREWPTLRFFDFATFRVVSRPDFSCYLFDESWGCFAEFRGNPGCIVPRRRSGGQNEGETRVKARERDSDQRTLRYGGAINIWYISERYILKKYAYCAKTYELYKLPLMERKRMFPLAFLSSKNVSLKKSACSFFFSHLSSDISLLYHFDIARWFIHHNWNFCVGWLQIWL